ncbi:hypothetical protein D7S86_11265 [Pararobbsia silviterrae]|uniref:Uncharacterized protein n=1 Tax=Pararobbsia silviterrae TaxID=1792498 RepID=A0A494Y782_9BURK|nr:hypothetical protein D7S86_11265 [Pararobbsia silviterrae]
MSVFVIASWGDSLYAGTMPSGHARRPLCDASTSCGRAGPAFARGAPLACRRARDAPRAKII